MAALEISVHVIVDSHAPCIKVRPKQATSQWISDEARVLMKSRNYFMKKYRRTRDPSDWEYFRQYRNAVKKSLMSAKKDHFTQICNDHGKQPRRVWAELNKAIGRKRKPRITHLQTGTQTLTAPPLIANELNTHFITAAGPPNGCSQLHSPCQVESRFRFRPFNEDEVLCALKKLNTHKATGVDGIPSHLLRTLAPVISSSITMLFNTSLAIGEIPSEWNMANITPVQKKPGASHPTDYRPISVLPVIAKVYESLIHSQLYSYMTSNSLLHPSQSGFRPGHSTQDVLLKTVDDWRIALDRGEHVGTVLIDLSKAFDSMDHELLLKKLLSYGIVGNELNWFSNYLTNRQQRVTVDGSYSEWANISKGVPQGSILGPLLFLTFVNDLPKAVETCTVNLYADDTTIYYSNKDPNLVQAAVSADLENIALWIEANGLRMNVAKTQLMTLRRKCLKPNQHITIELKGNPITEHDTIKYLGVTVDKDLNWKPHVAEFRRKTLAAIATIRRARCYLPVHTRKMLYNALILPHMDYCSAVWHSCSNTLSQSIERIQNYAMRVILDKPPRTPSAPLRNQLNWHTLHQRRENSLLTQVHRCVLHQAPSYLSSKFTRNCNRYTSTRGANKLHLSRPSTEYYRSCFEFQGAVLYNKLEDRNVVSGQLNVYFPAVSEVARASKLAENVSKVPNRNL